MIEPLLSCLENKGYLITFVFEDKKQRFSHASHENAAHKRKRPRAACWFAGRRGAFVCKVGLEPGPYASTATSTSVLFTKATAGLPTSRPSSSMAALVMEPETVRPYSVVMFTWPLTAPF